MLTSADIGTTAFTITRFLEGYEMTEVDALLEAVRSTLAGFERPTILGDGPAMTAFEVVNARFQPTKFRSGYKQDEVDIFLDRVVEALRTHEATR